ncbi:PqqD family protein [Micromonospora sp. M12]
MTEQKIVHRVDPGRVAWRAAGDEVVVLDTTDSIYFVLDPAGALLWQRLLAGATSTELVTALVETATVDRERARADVAAFLDDLGGHGLLLQRP